MKRKYLFVLFFYITVASFAQDAPMRGWRFNSFSVELNGRRFYEYDYPDSWCEQEGFALVLGQRLRYWLYDTYTYRNGYADELLNRVLPSWVEGMGYVIDFDNIRYINPNNDLATSVKALMSQRGADISVTIYSSALYVNNFDRSKGIYSTIIYPLYGGR
jgi:hypothetical protein